MGVSPVGTLSLEKNYRLSEGKQVFCISHIFVQIIGTVNYPYQLGNDGNTPEIQVPKPKANLARKLF